MAQTRYDREHGIEIFALLALTYEKKYCCDVKYIRAKLGKRFQILTRYFNKLLYNLTAPYEIMLGTNFCYDPEHFSVD